MKREVICCEMLILSKTKLEVIITCVDRNSNCNPVPFGASVDRMGYFVLKDTPQSLNVILF